MADNLTLGTTMAQERYLAPFEMDYPEINAELMMPLGLQGLPQYQILRNLGLTKAVTQNHGKYFYQDRMQPILHCAGALSTVVAPSAGVSAQYSFVLNTTTGNNDLILGAVSPDFPQFGTTNYYYQPAIIGMKLQMPNFDNNVQVRIYDITGEGTTTVTVFVRVDPTNTALTTASYVAGTPLPVVGNAYAAGDDMPDGMSMGVLADTWTMQNIWNTYEIDGDQLTNRIWISKTSNGKDVSGYRLLNQWLLDYRHARDIDDALWNGSGNNNPLAVATGTRNQNVIYNTEGVLTYADRAGTNLNYPIGMFNPMFFDQIDSILVKNYAPKYFMGCCDANFKREFTWSLTDLLKFTEINHVIAEAESALFPELGGEGGKSVKISFQYLESPSGYVYCMNTFYRFNDPNGLGAAGQNGNNFAFFCPIGNKPDPKSPGNKVPYFGMYYKAMDGYNRLGEVNARYGATNGTHTLSADKNVMSYKSHIGAVHVGGINMVTARGI